MRLGGRWRAAGFAVIATAALSACGGGRARVPLAKLEARLVSVKCQASVRCGEFPDDATCEAATGAHIGQLMADVAAGTCRYDEAAAANCLDAVAAMGCGPGAGPNGLPEVCAETFKGTVPLGGACFVDTECASGNCEIENCPVAACCTGVCEPLIEAGEVCPAGTRCVPTATCKLAAGAPMPTCVPRVGIGRPCEVSEDCASGLTCYLPHDGTAPACELLPATGEACEPPTFPCASGKDDCDEVTHKCTPRIVVGGACGAGVDCVAYASCTASMKCLALRGVGEKCATAAECLAALDCTDGACARPPADPVCGSLPPPDAGSDERAGDDTAPEAPAPAEDAATDTALAPDDAGPADRPNDDAGTDGAAGANPDARAGDATEAADAAPAPAGPVVQLALGGSSACALRANGSMWCWGEGFAGELGDGTMTLDRPQPAPVPALGTSVVRIGMGVQHSMAITKDHSLWLWGMDNTYQLGDGAKDNRLVPWQLPAFAGVTASMSAGEYTTCAVKTDGTAWCWGQNFYGTTGDGTLIERQTPVQVTVLGATIAQISAFADNTCAVRTDGTVWCWGTPYPRTYMNPTGTPEQIATITNAVQVAVGDGPICVRTKDGYLWCWGWNNVGQVGDGTMMNRSQPVLITSLGNTVADVGVGSANACARKTDGTVWCWGSDIGGALGTGGNASATPVQVTDLGNTVVELVVSDGRACARKADDTVWCWGVCADGVIVQGQMNYVTRPVQIMFPP
jgi:alpha-tubulin suppressor-like RCC1 family protein